MRTLALILLCFAPSLTAAPLLTAQADSGYSGETVTSSTFARATDYALDWDCCDPYEFFVNYTWDAIAVPLEVSAEASLDVEGDLPPWFTWNDSGFAEATAEGQLMITGGTGLAYVDFMLFLGGDDACATFSPLGADVSRCQGHPALTQIEDVPFRFDQPFAYRLTAFARIYDGFSSSSAAELRGIAVYDAAGRPLQGARLVWGDFQPPPPPAQTPEPATALLSAAGLLWLALRRRGRQTRP